MADVHAALRRLPADVVDLNEIARGAGLEVTASEAPEIVYVRWRGTEGQLRSTGLIKRSWRLPVTHGQLWLPHEQACWFIDQVGRSFINGEVTMDADGVRFTFDAKVALPLEVSVVDGVEICRFSDRSSFYGEPEALLRGGYVHERQMAGKRSKTSKSIFAEEAGATIRWRSRWHPSGKVIHYRESEELAAKRSGGRVQATPVLNTVVARVRVDQDFQRFMTRALAPIGKHNDRRGAHGC